MMTLRDSRGTGEDRTKSDVFDRIAPGWYNFRHWSIFRTELEELEQRWRRGSLLNIGCAHGPDFLPFRQNFTLYGVDFSPRMLGFARKYSRKFGFDVNLSVADAAYLPYRDGAFDWAISVATYHHIRGKEAQQRALDELWRVLKPGGEAFITVWNRWQPRFWFMGKEVSVPWRTRDEVLGRYYYLFSYPELEGLVRKAGFSVLKSFPESSYRFPLKFFSRNICLLVQKSGLE
ncbi:MAG: class I SAM-dependent methyltransferase [Dehalococcoidales bacterium]|nr:class I SAM-dependent methyltransferase [Dehalococcoidales bacterium]